MTLFVSGKPMDSDKTKLFTDEQLLDLADSVCFDLELEIDVVRLFSLTTFIYIFLIKRQRARNLINLTTQDR